VRTETQSTPTPTVSEDRHDETAAMVHQFVRFMRLLKRISARFASQQEDGIEHAAYVLLANLVMDGPQRTTTLAEAVHADTSTVSRQIGALVRHGLVAREADPVDGRACLLVATPEGKQCYEQQHRARIADLARTLEHWSADDLRSAATLLDRLNTDLENHELRKNGATSAASPKGGNR
jgi:DNA-binding MarR family transcriptional regulator